jgi:hypothetical protein
MRKVTQADRDAAATLFEKGFAASFVGSIRSGERDRTAIVQIAAAARIAERDRCLQIARGLACGDYSYDMACADISAQIADGDDA